MKCEKCGGKKLQVVSEYKQLETKGYSGVLIVFNILYALAIILGFVLMAEGCNSVKSEDYTSIFNIPMAYAGLKLIFFAIVGFIVYFIVKSVAPYDHETKIKVVCMDCGHSWELKEPDTSTPEEKEQNKN